MKRLLFSTLVFLFCVLRCMATTYVGSFVGNAGGVTNIYGFIQWQTNAAQLAAAWQSLPVYGAPNICGGGTIYLSNGVYMCSSLIFTNLTPTDYRIIGTGPRNCVLVFTNANQDGIFVSNNVSQEAMSFDAEHVALTCSHDTTNFVLHLLNPRQASVYDCIVGYYPSFTNANLFLGVSGVTASNLCGVCSEGFADGNPMLLHCQFGWLHQGLVAAGDHLRAYELDFENCAIPGSSPSQWPTNSYYIQPMCINIGGGKIGSQLYDYYFDNCFEAGGGVFVGVTAPLLNPVEFLRTRIENIDNPSGILCVVSNGLSPVLWFNDNAEFITAVGQNNFPTNSYFYSGTNIFTNSAEPVIYGYGGYGSQYAGPQVVAGPQFTVQSSISTPGVFTAALSGQVAINTNVLIGTNAPFNVTNSIGAVIITTNLNSKFYWNPSFSVPGQFTGAWTNQYNEGEANWTGGGGFIIFTNFNLANDLATSQSNILLFINAPATEIPNSPSWSMLNPPNTLTTLSMNWLNVYPSVVASSGLATSDLDMYSNSWSLVVASNGMVNFSTRFTSSNGVPVSIYSSNGVAFVYYFGQAGGGILP